MRKWASKAIEHLMRDTKSEFWAPRRLGHANLFIGSYERAADYYRDMVGFREVYRQPNNMATFVSNGNTYHDLGLTDIHSRYCKPGQKPGLWHLAFEVENEVDLVDGYNRAIAAGVQFQFTEDHDVAHSLYFKDPDGLLVEVYADVMDEWRAHRKGIINKEKPKYIPLLAGQIEMMFFPVHTAMPHVKAGKMKALAVGAAKRHPNAPDIPTMNEVGVPNVEVEVWYAFFGPKNLPAPILARLNKELRAILAEPDVMQALNKSGLDTESSSPEELRKIVQRDFPRWAAIIKKNNITSD